MIHFSCRGGSSVLPGYPPFLSALLSGRGLTSEEAVRDFLDVSIDKLTDPQSLPGMRRAVQLLKTAAETEQTVAVYGDYDADGVCASAIVFMALREYGIPVRVFLPDRHGEGYGLNEDAIRQIAAEAGLLLTVDNGVTAVNEITLAKQLGLTVIVTDHHHPHESLPPADVLICPAAGGYPYSDYCGAALAWQLARALLGKRKAAKWLDLCALATFADMVPLTGENRVIAANGLKAIDETENPGLLALMDAAFVKHPLTAHDASFTLAPRINACGRLDSAYIALQLLTEEDPEKARTLAARTQQLNDQRRAAETQTLQEAREQLRSVDLTACSAIVLWSESWDTGVVGLAAGKLADETGYPTVILAAQGDKLVGSARSAADVDIHEALTDCADLFLRFGGHRQAAGMTLKKENGTLFRERLSEAVEKQLKGRRPMPHVEYDSEITLKEITIESIRWLQRLEPCGMGNPEPRFLVNRAEVQTLRPVGADMTHLKCSFRQGSTCRNGIAFSKASMAGSLGRYADLIVYPQINDFRGEQSPEMQVISMRSSVCLPAPDIRETASLLEDLLLSADKQETGWAMTTDTEDRVSAMYPRQGCAILCRTRNTAERFLALCPESDIHFLISNDKRAYFSLLLGCGHASLHTPFKEILLADGELYPGDARALAEETGARVYCACRSDALISQLERFRIGREALLSVWKAAKCGDLSIEALAATAGVSCDQALSGLYILRNMRLLDFTLSPFGVTMKPTVRSDPEADRLYRSINT